METLASAHLGVFFVMVLGIIVMPGMDMAFVLANALAGGKRRGLLAVAGIVVGGACHVVAAALGLGLLLKLWPALFNIILLAGAAYIAWIGLSLLRAASAAGALPAARAAGGGWSTFRQAVITCLLNPKAYLFMLAVFPQFLRPEQGQVWLQSVVLWVIIAVTQTGVYGAMAVAAASVAHRLTARPQLGMGIVRAAGAVLMLGAAWTGWMGWRGL